MVTPSQNQNIVEPDLAKYLKNRINQIKADINCCLIGTINSFDPSNQTASVRVNYQRRIVGGLPIGNNQVADRLVDYPILINCPVVFLNGGGGCLTFPVVAGDSCLLIFNDRELDIWLESAYTSAPNSYRMHDLNDAIVLVGIRPYTNPIANFSMDGPNLQFGVARVAVEDRVRIQVASVTLQAALDALLLALTTWVDTHGDSPNAATLINLNAAKVLIDGVLK